MKKHMIFLTAAAMAILLTGCGGMTKEKILQEMETAVEDKNISALSMILDMDMAFGAEGITVDIGMDMDMNIQLNVEKKSAYLDMNMDIEAVGETMSETMQMYMLPEDNALVGYIHTGSTDTWEKQDLGTDLSIFEETASEEKSGSVLSNVDADSITLAEETEDLDGIEVYVLSYTLTGEEIQKSFDESEYSSTIEDAIKENGLEDLEGMDELASLFDFDFTSMNMPVTVYVDTKTYLPVQMTMDIEGLEELINPLLSGIMAMTGEEMEMTMTIETLNAVCTDFSYDAVEVPALPEGAKEAAEAAELAITDGDTALANDSYIIQEGSSAVTITPPSGWILDASDYDYVSIYDKENYNFYISFAMYEGMTSDDFSTYVENDMVSFYQENGYYTAHGWTDKSLSFPCFWIECNDASVLYYTWIEVGDNGHVFIEIDDYSGQDMITTLSLALSMIGGYSI